jgi:hypothetical protein
MGLGAKVELIPVMSAGDLRQGLGAPMQSMARGDGEAGARAQTRPPQPECGRQAAEISHNSYC